MSVTGIPEELGVTVATDTVPDRTISQTTMDAVVAGFLARDPALGEIEDETVGDGTTEGEETTAEGEGDGGTTEGEKTTAEGEGEGTETIPSS